MGPRCTQLDSASLHPFGTVKLWEVVMRILWWDTQRGGQGVLRCTAVPETHCSHTLQENNSGSTHLQVRGFRSFRPESWERKECCSIFVKRSFDHIPSTKIQNWTNETSWAVVTRFARQIHLYIVAGVIWKPWLEEQRNDASRIRHLQLTTAAGRERTCWSCQRRLSLLHQWTSVHKL